MSNGVVKVSVANLYRLPRYSSEIVSQVLLGEKCALVQKKNGFTRVILEDGYKGWLSDHQWVDDEGNTYRTKRVRSHFLRIFEKPDPHSRPVRDAVIGTCLNVVEEQADWVQVVLPDGIIGYASGQAFGSFPASSRAGIKELALEFCGYPYYWGGRSPRGFDCSGLVQTVFTLMNIKLPRDSWMQHRDGKPVSRDPEQAQVGDLCFFSDQPGAISHVAIAMGEGKIIHARGMVGINSLRKGATEFRQELLDSFVEVRTYFGLHHE
jgi:hypothetical protein